MKVRVLMMKTSKNSHIMKEWRSLENSTKRIDKGLEEIPESLEPY